MSASKVTFKTFSKSIRFLIIGSGINNFGMMIAPFLTLVLVQKMGMTPTQASVISGAMASGVFVSVLAGGWASDRFGRRPVMLVSLGVAGMIAMLIPQMKSTFGFSALLMLWGFFSDLFRPASSAMIADHLSEEDRLIGIAYVRVALNVGVIGAFILGGIVVDWNWKALYYIDGATTLIYFAIGFFGISDRTPNTTASQKGARFKFPKFSLPKNPKFRAHILGSFLACLVYMTHIIVFPLWLASRAGYSHQAVGLILTINGLLVSLSELTVVRWVKEHLSMIQALRLGYGLIGLGLGMTGMSAHPVWIALTVILWSAGEVVGFSMAMSLTMSLAPPEKRGQYISYGQATWKVAGITCPLLFLPLFERMSSIPFWLLVGAFMLPVLRIYQTLDLKTLPSSARLEAKDESPSMSN